MILISGVNKSKIFKIIKNTPIVTKQKIKIAKTKTNLNIPSPILFKINNKKFYRHILNLYIFCHLSPLLAPFLIQKSGIFGQNTHF